MAAPSPTSRSQRANSSRLFRCRCNDCRSRVTWSRRREYRVEKPVAKLGGRHRSSVVELSIRNPARPAHTGAGRRVFNDLRVPHDGRQRPATPPLAPPLAPRLGRVPPCELLAALRTQRGPSVGSRAPARVASARLLSVWAGAREGRPLRIRGAVEVRQRLRPHLHPDQATTSTTV